MVVPVLELFSSKGGKLQSLGRNEEIPREGFEFSNGGKYGHRVDSVSDFGQVISLHPTTKKKTPL